MLKKSHLHAPWVWDRGEGGRSRSRVCSGVGFSGTLLLAADGSFLAAVSPYLNADFTTPSRFAGPIAAGPALRLFSSQTGRPRTGRIVSKAIILYTLLALSCALLCSAALFDQCMGARGDLTMSRERRAPTPPTLCHVLDFWRSAAI